MADDRAVINARMAAEFINKYVTYKPRYRLTAGVPLDTDIEYVQMVLIFAAQDSEGDSSEEKQLCFTRRYPWPQWGTIGFIKDLLREFVHTWETHEADEWLKVDDVKVHDPHG